MLVLSNSVRVKISGLYLNLVSVAYALLHDLNLDLGSLDCGEL